ncbi:type III-B CRISPR module RAMP protein Cmr6 [Halothiobacillus sp. 15-55-196]|jgi:CRISPR-associated protein Cmr6|uniref:type III-B CRISPR module RAMP protein Cmr6 n=1 Tax=Halothiobacillus sp. 15-55-196 TaxID=1970382 RepID=UPI0025C3A63D|nr:type III-B CRISPR module RAMP protein Cmr6 [Halothiobacillus sp. 15-55-196]
MPIAAVPKYLGQDFKNASPGMRFGMYLKLWGVNNRSHETLWTNHDINYRVTGQASEERAFKYENKVSALKDAQALNAADKEIMQSLKTRQEAGFASVLPHEGIRLEAIATAPFTTGLGNEHPLENGFAFLNPYGLPYLPGSGVKGVLRQAARELASGEWGDSHGWSVNKNIELRIGKTTILLSLIDALFGLESQDGEKEHLRGALTFWDVIPQIAGNSLAVEIMTPHQSHYYQQKSDRKSGDSETPHDSGSPTPLNFLTVPPGSGFSFFVTCDTTLLTRHAPHLVAGEHWRTLLQAAFEHAFEWLGFGAKTAVGYGAMGRDKDAEAQAEQARIEKAHKEADEARRALLSPEDLAHEEELKQVEVFRQLFETARKSAYQPGSAFDQQRLEFVKTVLEWIDPRSRQAAGELLAATMSKAWGTPGKKERKQQISEAIQTLKG